MQLQADWQGLLGDAQVYKAMLGGSSIVAVKVLHETDEAADFGQEIAILRSCRHSNIVQFQVHACSCHAHAVHVFTGFARPMHAMTAAPHNPCCSVDHAHVPIGNLRLVLLACYVKVNHPSILHAGRCCKASQRKLAAAALLGLPCSWL